MIDVYESEAAQKDSRIDALQKQLRLGTTTTGTIDAFVVYDVCSSLPEGRGGATRGATAKRKGVEKLEKRIEELERELERRHPNPVAALLRASKPSRHDEHRLLSLREQIDVLKKEVRP